jgi:hypothetical protein
MPGNPPGFYVSRPVGRLKNFLKVNNNEERDALLQVFEQGATSISKLVKDAWHLLYVHCIRQADDVNEHFPNIPTNTLGEIPFFNMDSSFIKQALNIVQGWFYYPHYIVLVILTYYFTYYSYLLLLLLLLLVGILI